ncbi:MAG: FxsA family protein [Tateyamaria sp.]|jgi:UPF0716 protein FxsA|nr:FxsA family protein [Tateyamaria sp.]
MWLFIAFIAIPLIEIVLFIQVGGAIGLPSTLLIVILTAILGTFLLKNQGSQAFSRITSSFQKLTDPSEALANGAMIIFAGALLLTPGFLTDIIGLSLLIPYVRLIVFKWVRSRLNIHKFTLNQNRKPHKNQENVIDGEYFDVSQEKEGNKNPSGWTKD